VAGIREGELLRTPANQLLLALALLAPLALAGPARGDGASPDPVFFKSPDPVTARLIADALELLKNQPISDHTEGRRQLVSIGYWTVPPLIGLLRDGSSSERRNAALALGTILDRRAILPLLKTAENDSHLFVPSFATLVMGKFEAPDAIPRLDDLVQERKKDHRRISAVLSIAKLQTKQSYDILERVALSRDLTILRETATFCMGFYRDRALVRGEGGVAEPCPALERALAASQVELRRSALLAVALLGHRDLKELYLKYADWRQDQSLQQVALLALGRFPDEDVTRLYLNRLSSQKSPERVKLMAAMMMKDRKDPKVLVELRRLNPQDKEVKAALTLTLSNYEDEETVKKLIVRLTDNSNQVRGAAAIGLSRLTDPDLKALAIRALTDILTGKAGTVEADVRHNMDLARRVLKTGKKQGEFIWLGNREFADALPKDVEERVLDYVNKEVERVLGVTSLQPEKAIPRPGGGRREVNDEASDLRDLKVWLENYPYFEPFDIPVPKIAITPQPEPLKQEGN
jgi:HEAT repeat protein